MKIFNFSDDTTLFLLRDINCHTRIKSILKLYEKAYSSKMNFSKIQTLWARACKNRIVRPRQIVWSQFSIKILGVHFFNSVLYNNNWEIINRKKKKKKKIGTKVTLFEREKINVNQILSSKLWYMGPISTIIKNIKEKIKKEDTNSSVTTKKKRPLRLLVEVSIWKGELGILDIDAQLNSFKTKWIQRLFNSTNALWKAPTLYWWNLILNSSHGLVLFRQT